MLVHVSLILRNCGERIPQFPSLRGPMSWKSVLGALIRCEISASYDWLGNVRISAKGVISVIVVWLSIVWLSGGHLFLP